MVGPLLKQGEYRQPSIITLAALALVAPDGSRAQFLPDKPLVIHLAGESRAVREGAVKGRGGFGRDITETSAVAASPYAGAGA
jgi:hypothetical protein